MLVSPPRRYTRTDNYRFLRDTLGNSSKRCLSLSLSLDLSRAEEAEPIDQPVPCAANLNLGEN